MRMSSGRTTTATSVPKAPNRCVTYRPQAIRLATVSRTAATRPVWRWSPSRSRRQTRVISATARTPSQAAVTTSRDVSGTPMMTSTLDTAQPAAAIQTMRSSQRYQNQASGVSSGMTRK